MADSQEFVRLMEANAALVASLVQALQGVRPAPAPTPLQRLLGHPESPGDPTVDEWLTSGCDSVVCRRGSERVWC